MKKPQYWAAALILMGCAIACSNKKSEVSSQEIENPILDQSFPDPTVIRGGDGYYYAYGTEAYDPSLERSARIQIAKSENFSDWKYIGEALANRPGWAVGDFWAPHVFYDDQTEKYYMYYSGKSKDDRYDKCLGVAVSDTPIGPFVDKGEPLLCGDGFINIDPMAFDDPATGKKLLYWGSGFGPIKVQELSNDRLSFKPGSTAKDLIFPDEQRNYSRLIEGVWIDHENGKYYLYYSGDNCCGNQASYAVMVARADAAEGPFERFGEAQPVGSDVILEKDKNYTAPGHNSIVEDPNGVKWMVYHAIDRKNKIEQHLLTNDTIRYDRRVPMMTKLSYVDGWPQMVNSSASPEID